VIQKIATGRRGRDPSATAQDAFGEVNVQASNDATQRENIFNQTDFLYALNTGPIKHEFMAGVEYGRQVTDNFRNNGYFNNNFTNPGRTSSVAFFNPVSLVPLTFRPDPTGAASGGAATANNHGVVEVVGVYLQDQITLHPQVKAVLGIRHDNFDLKFRNHNTGQLLHTNDGLISPRVGLI
jgi:catecholate siderophore receptor